VRAVLGAVVLVVVAGCSSPPKGLAAATYADRACTAVGTYETALTKQATAYQADVDAAKGSPLRLKALAGTFLGQQVSGTGTLVTALRALPQPAGTGGAAVKSAIVAGAQSAHQDFATQQTAVAAADATNRTTFFQVLDTSQQQVSAAGEAIANGIESVGQYGDAALNAAFDADAACADL
jgi:hypothetical protein